MIHYYISRQFNVPGINFQEELIFRPGCKIDHKFLIKFPFAYEMKPQPSFHNLLSSKHDKDRFRVPGMFTKKILRKHTDTLNHELSSKHRFSSLNVTTKIGCTNEFQQSCMGTGISVSFLEEQIFCISPFLTTAIYSLGNPTLTISRLSEVRFREHLHHLQVFVSQLLKFPLLDIVVALIHRVAFRFDHIQSMLSNQDH